MTETEPENVLLVEDNPTDARLIKEYILEQHWPELTKPAPDVHHVDRLEAAKEARDETVDIVLLDLGLPDSTGIETLERMLEAAGDKPVVVLTGLDDERVGLDAVERGAQDYLIKDELTSKFLQQTLRYAIERERQQRELERRNEELALLNQIVRHDIRNDVTIISGWGDILDDHVEPDGEPYLENIMQAATHITGITQTVGDFLQVLEDETDLDLRPMDVGHILDAELEKARTAHDDTTYTIEGELPVDVDVAATELLSSVFRNLLNNAATHNDKDDPRVWISVEERPESVAVSIVDNGPGVPDSQKDEIFGRGEMGLESAGTGIGLYLVDTLVEMYQGAVTLEDGTDWETREGTLQSTDREPDGAAFTVVLQKFE
jgi:signal transduction histidine kinase